ncbi:MAG: dipeptide epimerase [Planctomycetaceae bacterium]|nr:dipeptide epimerase [Planctomycetaceae bacterium]
MRLRLIRIDLPLRHVFTHFRREVSTVRSLIVELEQDGLRGHGEANEDLFYGATIEQIYTQLDRLREKLEYYALADPLAFWRFLQPQLEGKAFAQCAIDCAAHDLWGKMKNKPIWKIWGLSREHLPVSSYSIGIDSLVRIGDRFVDKPDWAAYRIKLGSRQDLDTLKFLREKTDADFYVDVNGGWTLEKAVAMLKPMQELGVKLLEQPLNAQDFAGMVKLKKEMKRQHIDIPVFADESWKTESDIEKCAEVFDGINIKLLKCGGLTPVRKLIEKVRALGLKVSAANTVESPVGAAATAQIASLVDYIGLDGPLQIDKKVGHSIRLDKGQIRYPDEGGTGVRASFR